VSVRPFTPTQEPAEDLDRRTVGRDQLLGVLGEWVRLAATTRTRQHTLLVGPRGAARKATIVVVIENLNRVFRAIGLSGQRDLRSRVESSGKVLVLASAPVVFASVRDRAMPWFGGLIETPVGGLTAAEGRELLIRLARDRGDDRLAGVLESELGTALSQTIGQLTGGLPRVWTVLSECADAESLTELTPAIVRLVERLAPHHQQLLWGLPDNHQVIVRQLAQGASAAMTASGIANETGLTPQTATKALGLLRQAHWVRDEKLPLGSDQRRTWYRLRDPMLRHHLQWRVSAGEPLRLIIALLRQWYDPSGNLARALDADASGGATTPQQLARCLPSGPDRYGILDRLIRARAGDHEARLRLPAELRPLVDRSPD